MKTFNKLYGLSLISLLLSAASCTSETEEPHTGPGVEPSEEVARREVVLTLKNKLSVVSTKADPIATADENKISSLDIYVFGCKTEDGTYTYQERFCYRENSADMPSGSDVTALDLTAKGSDGKETTALLSLKKGLFVKLYCIANQSKLIDPTTGNVYSNFIPLTQSKPGQADNDVTEGEPKENDFKLFQSIQLNPASTTDILTTPLPMTGAYASPLDLTDFSVSARLQLGFRLTRSVARFDIVNDAKTSKFTIESVSMSNGRKGVSFFPLKVTGTLPTAATGELITYPARKFDGDKANEGTSTGAFYTWPSPVDDGGYLILSGTYATNQTENIPVTYKVPFKPAGDGNYIEVSQNHRYTVNITAADEYHLDFTIDVADWTDEGSIDDYEPGADLDKDGMTVDISNTYGTYDKETRTVTMSVADDATFTMGGASVTGYYSTMYYENGDTEHQWLTMTPAADNPPTKTGDTPATTYTIARNKDYKATQFPIATIRFTDKVTAKETIVIVQPIADPVVKQKSISAGSTFTLSEDKNEIVLYQTSSITAPTVTFSVFASGGSKLEFPDGDTPGNWLTITPAVEQDLSQADYTLTLNTAADDFPDLFPVAGKEMTIVNTGDETKKVTFTLKLKSDLTVDAAVEGKAEFDNATSTLRLYSNASSDKVKLTVNTIGGSEIVDLPGWVSVTKEGEDKNKTTYTFTANGTGANGKFVIRSKADNSILKTYTVYAISNVATYTAINAGNSYTTSSSLSVATTSNPSITFFPSVNSESTFTITSPKGATVSNPNSWVKTSSSEKTLSSGQIETTVKVYRGYSDANYATFNSNLSFTINERYSGNTRTVTVKQYSDGIVYPGSNVPAKSLSNNGINWWVAMVNENNGQQMDYQRFESNKNSICPSGWRIPSSANYYTLWGSSYGSGNSISYSKVSSAVLSQIKAIYGDTSGFYFSSDNQNTGTRCGMITNWGGVAYVDALGHTNGYVRCVKNK